MAGSQPDDPNVITNVDGHHMSLLAERMEGLALSMEQYQADLAKAQYHVELGDPIAKQHLDRLSNAFADLAHAVLLADVEPETEVGL